MPAFEFDVTINATITITANDRATAEKEASEAFKSIVLVDTKDPSVTTLPLAEYGVVEKRDEDQ